MGKPLGISSCLSSYFQKRREKNAEARTLWIEIFIANYVNASKELFSLPYLQFFALTYIQNSLHLECVELLYAPHSPTIQNLSLAHKSLRVNKILCHDILQSFR